MNLGDPAAEKKETYPDHHEEDTDGTKNNLGWGEACDLLREIQAIDGHIQRRDGPVPPLRSLGLGLHGRGTRELRGGGTARRL